ncbi:MAG TPA: sigma-70 family RNA polymerase sigma factor [Lichenihabitans sp.]|nr:sigma-70 family RNA polymerase sigma factor [Lichenihabitans sp.]
MTQDAARRRFAEAVMPQADQAFRLAKWLTRNPHDAEDIVQDAALRAFQAIGEFHGGNARAWFLTIVRRTAFTWLAKNRPKDLVFAEDLEQAEQTHPGGEPAFGAEPSATPEQALLRRQRSDRIAAAVEALPIRFRETIVLREMEDLSYREIAEILDVPVGTVMSRLARGRALLVADLAEERR